MKNTNYVSVRLTNREVFQNLATIERKERKLKLAFLLTIAEISRREVFREHGYPSMYAFLTGKLGHGRGTALKWIRLTRFILRFPKVIETLRKENVSFTVISRAAQYFTEDNFEALFHRIKTMSVAQVESFLAENYSRQDVGTTEDSEGGEITHSRGGNLFTNATPLSKPSDSGTKVELTHIIVGVMDEWEKRKAQVNAGLSGSKLTNQGLQPLTEEQAEEQARLQNEKKRAG